MLAVPQGAPQSKFNKNAFAFLQGLHDFNIYDHQRAALRQMSQFFANPNRPNIALCVLPTGTGKSGIAAMAPYVLNASKVLVITPSKTITDQLSKDFCGGLGDSFLESRGIIAAVDRTSVLEIPHNLKSGDNPAVWTMHNLVITNAHKFGATSNVDLNTVPPNSFDLVIVDEAHHYPAPTWRLLVDHFAGSRRIFLTATPLHNGGPILEHQEQCLVYQLPRDVAIESGIIRPLDFIEVGSMIDDYNTRIDIVMQRVLAEIAEHRAAQPNNNYQALILTHRKGEADDVALRANLLLNNSTRVYHSGSNTTPAAVMANNLAQFRAGGFMILVVCGKLLEGFDHKSISVVGILRNIALSSKVLFNQFVGEQISGVLCLPL